MIADTLRELDELRACYDAIADLACPDVDLQTAERDHLSQLLSYLNRRNETLIGQLRIEIGEHPRVKAVLKG